MAAVLTAVVAAAVASYNTRREGSEELELTCHRCRQSVVAAVTWIGAGEREWTCPECGHPNIEQVDDDGDVQPI